MLGCKQFSHGKNIKRYFPCLVQIDDEIQVNNCNCLMISSIRLSCVCNFFLSFKFYFLVFNWAIGEMEGKDDI